MSRLLKSLLSIPFCLALTVQADTAQDTLKRFVDGVQTFDARFDQTQTDERGKVTARSSGRFLLSRPAANAKSDVGRFRWAYEKPYEQLSDLRRRQALGVRSRSQSGHGPQCQDRAGRARRQRCCRSAAG